MTNGHTLGKVVIGIGKYDGLFKGYRLAKEQERLRHEYGVKDERVKIVERKSRIVMIWRSTLGFLLLLLRVLTTAAVVVLAVVGLTALVFPEPRNALHSVLLLAVEQLKLFMSW